MDKVDQLSQVDVCVVGAGLAGVLTALRLAEACPQQKVVIWEQSSRVGGRARTTHGKDDLSGVGFSLVTEEMFAFLRRTFQPLLGTEGLTASLAVPVKSAMVLHQQKFKSLSWSTYFSDVGLRTVSSGEVATIWRRLEQQMMALEVPQRDVPLAKIWSESKKHPALRAIEQWLHPLGFSGELLTWSVRALLERLEYSRALSWELSWDHLDVMLSDLEGSMANLQILRGTKLMKAIPAQTLGWKLVGPELQMDARYLVNATPPALMSDWLEMEWLPRPVMQQAIKVLPVSLVKLSLDLPQLDESWSAEAPNFCPATWILVENVTFQLEGEGKVSFKTWIDFEQSLDAPSVVKAVRRLRRAKEKLLRSLGLVDQGSSAQGRERIALVPVGPGHPATSLAARLGAYLELEQSLHGKYISFCGDMLGSSFSPDKNLMTSVVRVCDKVGQFLRS
ncbi:MAG: NAD(P)-binding protein [Zetaproteobacteria bacterium]|nr:NAD(P)-binding protein [Zetaproteobacteria bacterium]